MSHTVSVITPVHEPSAKWLPQAHASLVDQEMPPGWRWQWVIQEDGETGCPSTQVPVDDSRISIATAKPAGIAVARNMALARAEGDLVKVLDSDDQLTPGALARDITTFEQRPDIGWTTARVLDLMPDGSTVSWEHSDPPEGPIARGTVLQYFEQHNYRLPVHPATMCIRRNLLLALGGWMALPGGEDTGLLLAASAVSEGHFIGTPGLLYRKWPGQITGQPEFTVPSTWEPRMRLIHERAVALRSL